MNGGGASRGTSCWKWVGPPTYAPVPPNRTARATVSSQVGGRGGSSLSPSPLPLRVYIEGGSSESLSLSTILGRLRIWTGVEFGRGGMSGTDAICRK